MAASKNHENKSGSQASGERELAPDLQKDAIFDTLTSMLSELLDMPKKDFRPDTMLFEELPLDSLQLYELVVDLETKYDLHISDEAIEKVQTIDDVVEMISCAKS